MHRIVEPVVQMDGISITQAFVLFGISEGKIASIGSLCKQFGLNQGNASALCKNMEKSGLIKRTRSKEDERVVTLSLTAQGKKMIERLYIKSKQSGAIFRDAPMEKLRIIIKGMCELNELIYNS